MLLRVMWTLMLAFVSAAPSAPASGAVVILDFEGTVYSVRDSAGLLDGSISLGSPFHLHFVYDEAVPVYESHPISPASPTVFSFWSLNVAPSEMSFAVGSYAVAVALPGDPTDPSYMAVWVFDDSPSSPPGHNPDSYEIYGATPLGSLTASVYAILADATATAITNPTQLSSVPFDLDSWDPWNSGAIPSGHFTTAQISLDDPNDAFSATDVLGRIESIAATRVPEPSAHLLIAALVVAVGVRTRF